MVEGSVLQLKHLKICSTKGTILYKYFWSGLKKRNTERGIYRRFDDWKSVMVRRRRKMGMRSGCLKIEMTGSLRWGCGLRM
jgi:hypothetical protein